MPLLSVAQIASSSNSLVPWLTAVLGAVLGFAIHAIYTEWKERRRFVGLLRELLIELEEIKGSAERRAKSTMPTAGALEAPLPVEAWRLVVSTGMLAHLPIQPLRRLRLLYSEVATANYLANQWVSFVMISRLSDNESVRDAFDREAARVVRDPCIPVALKAGDVIPDIESVIRTQPSFLLRRLGDRSK